MNVREHDLPGIGKKFALTTHDGDRITIVIHNGGDREIYHIERGGDYPALAVRLQDAEARTLGAILGGAYFQPAMAASMETVLDQLSVEWLKVDAVSPLAGRTIRESAIRKWTGTSVIAILRNGTPIPNPQPSDGIEAGDTLMVVGSRPQVETFRRLLRGGEIG